MQTQTTKAVRTIDVIALEWFDKVNGNSYFAGKITVKLDNDEDKLLKDASMKLVQANSKIIESCK